MTIIELINNWTPRVSRSRTFLIPYSDEVFNELCDFIWGNMTEPVFYDFLESNSNLCINLDYTNVRSNYYLSDKYIKARIEYFTFYNNDLFILYQMDPKESKKP